MLDLALHALLLVSDLLWLVLAQRRTLALSAVTLLWGICAGQALALFALVSTGDAFAAMRAVAWLMFVHAPLVMLVGTVLSWRSSRAEAWLHLLTALVLAFVALDAFVLEPQALQVNRFTVQTQKLASPLRIVVLSDLQTDAVGDYEKRVFELAMAEKPDLIVLPGDFLQIDREDDRAYREQVTALRELLPILQAPLGVFAVRGNVDTRSSWAADLFGGTQVHAAEGTWTETVGPLRLSALSFSDGFDPALKLPEEAGFHVAFAHGPDFSLSPDVAADLLIAGHTHGGQVQLPGFGPPITLSRVARKAAAGGLTELDSGRHLVVSRGIGLERGRAPRLRFRCKPEIVVVDVIPEM